MSAAQSAPDPWGILAELRALRAEHALVLKKLEALEAQKNATVLDSRAMAARFNKPSVEAFNRWISRKGGAHVAALAKQDPCGRRYWLAVEVDALAVRGAR